MATANIIQIIVNLLLKGIHVLLEKPMELSTEKCMAIIEAQRASGAKLMIAYRLHFEPATIAAIEKVRSGALGQVHMFTSVSFLLLLLHYILPLIAWRCSLKTADQIIIV